MSEKSYNIKFIAIELVSKSLLEPPKDLDPQENEFTFNFTIDMKVNAERKLSFVITSMDIVRAKQNDKVADLKTLCVFELPDFEQSFIINDENKTIDTPFELEVILKAASLSTTRGIISSELRGTYLQNAVLPLIDMVTVIKNAKEKMEAEKKE